AGGRSFGSRLAVGGTSLCASSRAGILDAWKIDDCAARPLGFRMASEFDPYREALVVETSTLWPDDLRDRGVEVPAREARGRIEQALHAAPQEAAELTYERLHTGFCRVITLTPEDLHRA